MYILPNGVHYVPTEENPTGYGIITGNEKIEISSDPIHNVFGERANEIAASIVKALAKPEEQALYHKFTYDYDLSNGKTYPFPFCISKEEENLIVFLSCHDDGLDEE